MKIAIYARVSSETQAKEGTIDSQIGALREYAKTHELTILHECIDDGFSGTNLSRPALDQLRDLTADHEIDAVLVLSPDRLSRNQLHQSILLDEFKRQNIKVLFVNQDYKDNPEDQLMLQMQGVISEYERTKILDRTRRGTIHSVKNGQVIGGNVPYGYRFIPKSMADKAHWEIDEAEAQIVRMIFDLYTKQGLRVPAIVKRLESDGIPNRSIHNKWWTSSIYAILKNKSYTGMAYMYKTKSVEPAKSPKLDKYRKEKNSSKADRPREDWIGILVPSIVERDTWEAAQRLLKRNAIHSRRNNSKNEYLLRGLVVCGLCGSMASGQVSNQNTYYSCGAKRNKNITSKPHEENISVHRAFLDEKIWAGLVELLENPTSMKEQLSKRLDARNALIKSKRNQTDKTGKELEKLAIQEKQIVDAYREGVIGLDELKEQKEQIATRRKVLEGKRKAVPSLLEGSGQPEITMDMARQCFKTFSPCNVKRRLSKP